MIDILNFTVWEKIIYTLIVTHITIVAVTVFLHRSQAHKSLELSPILNHFFRFWLWLTTSMGTKEWVSVHRKHHAKCETEEDPHSPVTKGIYHILFLGVHYYRTESHVKETIEKYGMGTPDDWLENNLYSKYKYRAVIALLPINIILFGFSGILIWLTQMLWIPIWAAGVINGLGHWWGYRTFATKDTSTNISPWGIIIGGEELHNNHHAFPRSAKMSYKKGEFDMGWMYIKIFEYFGLAKVIERSPVPEPSAHNFILSEVFSVKMRILRKYEKLVMKKVAQLECDNTILDKSFENSGGKFREWWTRDKDILAEDCVKYLNEVLSSKKQMAKIYEMRTKLINAWQGMGFSVNERIILLNNWCNEAEKLGNAYIDSFVIYLRKKIPSNSIL